MSHESLLICSCESYDRLADRVCREGDFKRGGVERKHFPDGERYLRLVSRLVHRDVVIIGGTISEADTTELYDLACGAVFNGARSLTLIVPYFGYSTMERAVKKGEIVTGKTRARLLSSIPLAYRGNRIVLLDLHSEGLPFYFEGGIHTRHLYAKPLILEAARELAGDDLVLASTDSGRAKWVESLASDLGVNAAFVSKRRLDGAHTEVVGVAGDVRGKKVVIYDDMIRTGGSLMGAARAYLAAGATEVCAIATHGVLPGDALERLRAAGVFRKVVCTDSHPRALALQSEFLEIKSIAPLLVQHLESGRDGI
jgi:ribose-phosphate pyrophosphokinase